MKKTTLFKQYLQAPEIMLLPTAHDPLCAKIIERAGFKAVACAGYVDSAALIGAADVELLSLNAIADAVWRMADAVELPVFADGTNAQGTVTSVRRTVQRLEKAGAAALMLEDHVSSKLCRPLSGKRIVPADEFVSKIKTAVDARVDQDLTILARTDAIAVKGLGEAVERAHMCLEAGADWIFLQAESVDQLREIPRLICAPTLANMIRGGRAPVVSPADLQAMGFAAVTLPNAFTYGFARPARELASPPTYGPRASMRLSI